MNNEHILVVEDEPNIAEVVSLYLRRGGFLVQAVQDGQSALESLEREMPALVILDLMVPGVDGLTITRWLRDRSDVPIIIVTARRMEERLQDVPISITVFDQEAITKRNIVNPTDLAAYTPSLSTYQRYGPEKGYFLLRGFTQEIATAPSVGVYFAEVVAPRGGGGTTSGNGAAAGDFFDLQNVQVLKGPQGTLFGRNTTGGAVLLTPQRPTDSLEGYVQLSAGNYDMMRTQAVVNVPLADTFKVRLGVDRQKRDGYVRNRSGIGPDRYNDVDYVAARLSLLAELTPDLENYTVARYSRSDTNGYASRIVLCNPAATGRGALFAPAACAQLARQDARGDGLLDVEINNPNALQKITQWQVTNTTTWSASETLRVKNIISYAEFRERASFALGGDNFSIIAPGSPLEGTPFMYATIAPQAGQDNSPQSTFVEELQLQGESADGRLTWQLGGYIERSRPLGFSAGYTANVLNCSDIVARDCSNPLGSGSLTAPMTKDYYDTTAAYLQGTYALSDNFAVTAGIRYTRDKVVGEGQTTRILFDDAGNQVGRICFDSLRFQGPPAPNGSPTPLFVSDPSQCFNRITTKSSKPTWLVDLEYTPTEDLLFYAKYARGYRQGGLFFNNIGLETWDPEKVDTYELGAKASFRGTVSGYVNVAGFYNDFTNQQLAALLIGKPTSGFAGALGIVNAGKSRILGLEVDGSLSFFEGFRLDFGYSYLDTKLKSIELPTIPEPNPFAFILAGANEGSDLPYAPQHKLTVSASYTLPLDASIGDISFGATYSYTDSQGVTTPQSSPLYRLPSFELVNLNLDWHSVLGQPFDLALFVTNLTDERYPVGYGTQYSAAGYEIAQYAPPRMWGVRLRYEFGD